MSDGGRGDPSGGDDRLLNALPVGIVRCDRDGRLTQFNRRAAELCGRALALGEPVPTAGAGMGEVLETGAPTRDRALTIEQPDGTRIMCLADCDPLFDDDGALIGGVSWFRNVSETLRGRERWYRALLDALPVALYTTDAEGRLTYYNEAAVALAGTRPELGTNKWCVTWRLYHPDGRPMPHEDCPMAVTLKENRAIRGAEAIAERPDGTRVPFLPYPSPLVDENGALVGAVNMLVDISDRKAAELERQRLVGELRHLTESLEQRVEERTRALIAEIEERQSVELQLHQLQKTEAIGQLTGGVAHDFNNLLTAVMGNLDCIIGKAPGSDVAKHADAALRAARRGANLTQQLLAFSRRQRLEPKPTRINDLVSAMAELLLRTLGGTIRVHLVLSPTLWTALIDPNQIESAILNLAINARDAMPGGGALTLETANLRIEPKGRVADLSPGDYVVISVTDTGIGMAEDVRIKAFDPFFTTKDVNKGSGLGLSQVYGVARQSGGTAEIESKPGKGTTVRIYLPRAQASPEPAPLGQAGQPKRSPGRKERILLVDDDTDVRETIANSLTALGYDVAAVGSGEAAIASLERDAFDLLVIDFAMPEMNGAAAGRIIGERWPDLPILYITGYADPPALGAGPTGTLLHKPFIASDLDAKIRFALERHAARRATNVVPLRTQLN
ncbi:MAG TPA: ATP-binding protein [Stellaceae bacterium]|nr:ATP-binding protein [Stellaceae bacterium]